MKLTTKLLLFFIPFLVLTIGLVSSFSVNVAKNIVIDKEFEMLDFLTREVVLKSVNSRYQLLERSGLGNVQSFISSYQAETFNELQKLNVQTNKHFVIISQVDNELIFCTLDENQKPQITQLRDQEDIDSRIQLSNYLAVSTVFEPWQWRIYVLETNQAIAQSSSDINLLAAKIALIACVLCGLILWYIMQKIIISPIAKLQQAAHEIFLHKHKLSIDLRANDELQDLAIEMERMSEEIEKGLSKAQAASKAKSEFLATMSHEIRTPLNGLLGLTNILSDTELNLKQKELLEKLNESSETLSGIINDVLDLSKIESGKLTLEKRPFRPHELLQSIRSVFSHLASENSTQLICHNHIPYDTVLETDAVRIRQIVFNLVSNAVKFTKQGQIIVDMSLQHSDSSSTFVVSCHDTGIGIKSERLDAIFEEFEQSDNTTTREYGGSGLGLAIVKKLLTLLGGEIRVHSEHGNGTRFVIQVPVVNLPSEPLLPEVLHHQAKPISRKILIVEDNEINAIVTKSFVEKHGHICIICSNGQEAVNAVSQYPFDVVLMDIHMPVMDGIEATKHIRQNPAKGDIPIIGLTAEAFEERHQSFIESGMNAIVTKPVDEASLINAIEKVFYC